jgi:hypothetical protein
MLICGFVAGGAHAQLCQLGQIPGAVITADPSLASVGTPVDLSVRLNLINATCSTTIFNGTGLLTLTPTDVRFESIALNVLSGDGQTITFNASNVQPELSGTTAYTTFTPEFLYAEPGIYLPSAFGSLSFSFVTNAVQFFSFDGHSEQSFRPRTFIGSLPFSSTDGFGSSTAITVIAQVPEPETYAMLLAGLGLLASVTRRRRQNLSASHQLV